MFYQKISRIGDMSDPDEMQEDHYRLLNFFEAKSYNIISIEFI